MVVEKSIDADILLLSAGLGKRLRPITDKLPKPMVRLCGRPLIDWNLSMIARAGFKRVFVNLFYLKEQIREYVGLGRSWGLEVIFVEEAELLDTGGAIKNIGHLLKCKTLLTVNSDIIVGPDFDLRRVLSTHINNPKKPIATLVLRHDAMSKTYGEVGINSDRRVVEFLGEKIVSEIVDDRLMYIGVQALDIDILLEMPTSSKVFSITRDIHKNIILKQGVICSFVYDGYWSDLGTLEQLSLAQEQVKKIFSVPERDIYG